MLKCCVRLNSCVLFNLKEHIDLATNQKKKAQDRGEKSDREEDETKEEDTLTDEEK